MTETQRLRKELEKCRARNVAMFDVVRAATAENDAVLELPSKLYARLAHVADPLRIALDAFDKAIEKEGTG